MHPLEPPDSHHVRAALGWLELDAPREAAAELARLSSAAVAHPDALEARWRLCACEHRWADALAVAQELRDALPNSPVGWIDLAFALHELKRTSEAHTLLQPAAKRFPRTLVIPYNLACYSCQLGHLDDARRWLERAVTLRDRDAIRQMALADDDLEPLWPEIRAW